MIFKNGLEPVLIKRIFIGFGAILEITITFLVFFGLEVSGGGTYKG